MKRSLLITLSKEITKAAICPLAYLFIFVAGEIGMILFLRNPSVSFLQAIRVTATSSDILISSFFLFIFLSIVSLIGFKLLKRFYYLENNWFLFYWGIVMGVMAIFLLADFPFNPLTKVFLFLF